MKELLIKVDQAIKAIEGPCTCSRDCDREREDVWKVLQDVRAHLLSGQAAGK